MTVLHGDCLDILRTLPADSCDSLVTDPPAGISFMGKGWDGDRGGRTEWVAWLADVMEECLRILKPGAHALVWAIPRTSHWTMTALEDAGFEIRDVVTHLFGTGFPKSLDVSKAIDKEAGAIREVLGQRFKAGDIKGGSMHAGSNEIGVRTLIELTIPATDSARQWEGFGTALKPACEFWVLCRKPISEKTVAKNVLKWGTGALNIDASRIPGAFESGWSRSGSKAGPNLSMSGANTERAPKPDSATGRFPSNLVLDEEAAAALDGQSGMLAGPWGKDSKGKANGDGSMFGIGGVNSQNELRGKESGGASRFFYVAKASKSDRGEGNTHPTVKSTKLMSYLVRLVTPPGGTVLDPFMGSGSTLVAAKAEGMDFIGIEKEADYVAIAQDRLKDAL